MPARTPAQITQDIIAKLAITIPDMSTEIGTVQRKMIEAFSEAISESDVDGVLIPQLDIDSKSGTDLEDFVGIFGFGRLQGTRSSGTIRIDLGAPATQPILVPIGTQFAQYSDSLSTLTFGTTVTMTIAVDQQTIDIPAQCSVVGAAGNVAAASIAISPSGLNIFSCTNPSPFAGGSDDETDEELRARFKKTFLRNIAGTEDFYTAVPLQTNNVARVRVLGPVSNYYTQIQATTGANTLPSKNCKFVWPKGLTVSTDNGLPTEQWFTEDVDYSVTSGPISAPVVTATSGLNNLFLDINYEYCSTHSRNDPYSGKTNKVDVFVDGVNSVAVSEKLVTKAITLNGTTGSTYNVANFASSTETYSLTTSSKFQRLGSTPIITWPTSITVGATTYNLGTHYVGVVDTTTNAGSERAVSGIVWKTTPPADGVSFTANYTYDQTPQVINAIFKKSKQITTDVLTHSCARAVISFYFVIMYNNGATPATVNSNVISALQTYLNNLPFGSWIQFSDMEQVVHAVAGVDNCRIAVTADGAPYSAQEKYGSVSTNRTNDFQIEDNAVAVLGNVSFIRRTFNNWNS